MNQNTAILEALSEAECVLYYASEGNEQEIAKIKEMHEALHKMVKEWHELTGATLL